MGVFSFTIDLCTAKLRQRKLSVWTRGQGTQTGSCGSSALLRNEYGWNVPLVSSIRDVGPVLAYYGPLVLDVVSLYSTAGSWYGSFHIWKRDL